MSSSVPKPRPLQADGRLHGVVVACRRADGKWLCIRRSRHVYSPLKVCFPGGCIEAGEGQAEAVSREMKEEVGLEVRPVEQVWRWEKPEGNLILWGWTAEIVGGEISADPMEVAEVLWLSGAEVAGHKDGLESNRLFVACLPE